MQKLIGTLMFLCWITVITRTGTFTGQMTLPDGKVIAPTGKAFDLDFATTAQWDGDLLIEEFAPSLPG
jgi:hypothetical protein